MYEQCTTRCVYKRCDITGSETTGHKLEECTLTGHSWASAFRHPAFQSGTGAFRYRTGPPYWCWRADSTAFPHLKELSNENRVGSKLVSIDPFCHFEPSCPQVSFPGPKRTPSRHPARTSPRPRCARSLAQYSEVLRCVALVSGWFIDVYSLAETFAQVFRSASLGRLTQISCSALFADFLYKPPVDFNLISFSPMITSY
jgi:hypothetical protein